MTTASYQQFCPVAMAAEILCPRWTIVVLREMIAGSTRFNELRRGVPRMSPALLSRRLKELEAAGIVARAASSSDPALFEYHLTEAGRELGPLVEAFGIWGQRRIESSSSGRRRYTGESCLGRFEPHHRESSRGHRVPWLAPLAYTSVPGRLSELSSSVKR